MSTWKQIESSSRHYRFTSLFKKGKHKFARDLVLIGICLAGHLVSTASASEVERKTEDNNSSALLEADPPSDWWQAVQEDIQRSEYHVSWQENTHLPNVSAAFSAPNRAHNLRTYFTSEGIRVVPRTGDATAWQWGLTLTGYGYTGQLQTSEAAELVKDGNRMEYHRAGLIEWYINDCGGPGLADSGDCYFTPHSMPGRGRLRRSLGRRIPGPGVNGFGYRTTRYIGTRSVGHLPGHRTTGGWSTRA